MPDSKTQRRFMGMVHAVQSGQIASPSPGIAAAAKRVDPSVAKEIGSSSEKGLPEKAKSRRWRTITDGKIKKKDF